MIHFPNTQKLAKVGNILPRDTYIAEKNIHFLKEKEAHQFKKVVTWALGGEAGPRNRGKAN